VSRLPLVAIIVCAALLGSWAEGHAQSAVPSDSVTQRYRTALVTLRNSVSRVRSDIDRFRRDLQSAGARTVENRSRRLQSSCQSLGATLVETEPGVRVNPRLGARADELRAAERDLVQQMRSVRRVLRDVCEQGLAPTGPGEWADSLKAWGPYRTSRLEQSLLALHGASARFAGAAGIKIEPRLPSN